MVLGEYVGMEEVCTLAMCALVGRSTYRALGRLDITSWVEATWNSLLGYTPEMVILTRGWYSFIFKTPEDSSKILQNTWVVNGGSLMLKRWRLGFEPVSEYFQFRHVWVLFSSLPLQF
jgi:hypothetical protein